MEWEYDDDDVLDPGRFNNHEDDGKEYSTKRAACSTLS